MHRAPTNPLLRLARRAAVVVIAVLVGVVAIDPLVALATFKRSAVATRTDATGSLAAPTNVRCTLNLPTTTLMAWDAPSGVTTPSLLRYTVKRATDGSSSYTTLVSNQTGTSYTTTDPGNGQFDYIVIASYNNWTSPSSVILNMRWRATGATCS